MGFKFHFLNCLISRMTEYGIELNRFMDRFFVESRAVDMESLCIVAGEKVKHDKAIITIIIIFLLLIFINTMVRATP